MKYNVLTGLVHTYCKPYRTNNYLKAIIALCWRWLLFSRGYIIISDESKKSEKALKSRKGFYLRWEVEVYFR